MLPAGILAFLLPVEPEEGFYADPPIQRSKVRAFALMVPIEPHTAPSLKISFGSHIMHKH